MNRALLVLSALACVVSGCASPRSTCCSTAALNPVSKQSLYEPVSAGETDAGKKKSQRPRPHSSGITLLDAQGKLIFQLTGLHTPVRGFVEALTAAAPKVVAKSP